MKLLPFLLFTVLVWGQSDSIRYATLQKQLKTQRNTKEKLVIYDSLYVYGEKIGFPTGTEAELLAGIDLSKKLNDYGSLAKKTARIMSFYNSVKGTPEANEPFAKQIFEIEKKVSNIKALGNVYMYYGESLSHLRDNKKAIKYIQKALDLFVKTKDKKSEGFARLYLSWPLSGFGEFAKASLELQKSLRLFEQIKDKDLVFSARSELATLYSKNGFFKEAKKERAILFKNMNNDFVAAAVLYFNQGTDEGKLGNAQKQIEYYKIALENAIKSDNKDFFIPRMLLELTANLYDLNRVKEAADYFSTFSKKYPVENEFYQESYNTALVAQAIHEKQWVKAKGILKKQLDRNTSNNNWENLLVIQKSYTQVLEGIGDYKNALTHQKAYAKLKDSLFDVQKANGLSYYQTLYETEKRDKVITQQHADLVVLRAQQKAAERLLYFAIIAAISLIVIVLLFIKQRQARKEQKVLEQLSHHLLQAQEEERTKIARDLHDSLGQQLILLKQTAQKTAQTTMTEQIETVLTDMRAITRQLHPFLLKQLGLKAVLEDLINNIDEHSPIFFTHRIAAIDGLFTHDEELNLYRFFQESLNNILKHAQATEVDINIIKQGKNITVSIEDNGIGFIVNEKINDPKHLGLKTMQERVKILKGKLTIQSTPNESTLLKAMLQFN